MRFHSSRAIGVAAAALAFAAVSAGAQGKSQNKSHGKSSEHAKAVKPNNGDALRGANRDAYGNGTRVPPGLAKKPGQMPPGQYKKHYGTNEGADVLGGILRRRGYSVLRVVPSGQSQYVYYRTRDGMERRAIVSPGAERLGFSNVPAALLQEVLTALYH